MYTIFNLEIYPFDIMISFEEDNSILYKRLKELKIPKKEYTLCGLGSTADGKYMMFSNSTSIIRLPWIPKTPYQLGVLVHEITHATFAILSKVGMALSDYSEEAYTYLLQYITNKILNFIEDENSSINSSDT